MTTGRINQVYTMSLRGGSRSNDLASDINKQVLTRPVCHNKKPAQAATVIEIQKASTCEEVLLLTIKALIHNILPTHAYRFLRDACKAFQAPPWQRKGATGTDTLTPKYRKHGCLTLIWATVAKNRGKSHKPNAACNRIPLRVRSPMRCVTLWTEGGAI